MKTYIKNWLTDREIARYSKPPHYGRTLTIQVFLWYVMGKAYKHLFLIPRFKLLKRMELSTMYVEGWSVRRKEYKRLKRVRFQGPPL